MNIEHRIEACLLEQAHRLFAPSADIGDAETIHRMRVASRRLRVGLEFFGARFEPRELKQILQQLRRLGKTLGAVRVLDVNAALLREAKGCAALERELAAERRSRLVELRELHRAAMTAKLGSRVETLVVRPRGRPDGQRPLAELRRELRRCLDRFEKKRGAEPFHKLRIAAKKYRYGLEIVESVFGADADGKIKSVKTLQELMGACHDVEVLLERLPKGKLKKYFANEHERRYEAVKKFLDGGRRWVKKVKLNNE